MLHIDQSERYRLRRQWAVTRDEPQTRFMFRRHTLKHGFFLYYHDDCTIDIKSDSNFDVIVIGIAVNERTGACDMGFSLRASATDGISALQEVSTLYAGSYVAIVCSDEEILFLGDPAGFYGVYYSSGSVASTPSLLNSNGGVASCFPSRSKSGTQEWYTGSYCPAGGSPNIVRKLIPNHSLSILSNEIRRYWPTTYDLDSPTFEGGGSESNPIKEIASLFRRLVIGASSGRDCICSITGGYDSRIVASALSSTLVDAEFFTIIGKGIARADEMISTQVIDHIRGQSPARYVQLENIDPPIWLLDLYDEISAGESIGSRREIVGTCMHFMTRDCVHFNGNLGALLKSYYQPQDFSLDVSVSALTRDFLEKPSFIIDGVTEWIQTVRDLPIADIYSLFYLEQRGGRWMAAGENASRLFYESFSPFNSRKLYLLARRIPRGDLLSGSALRELADELIDGVSLLPYTKSRRRISKFIPEALKSLIRPFFKR